MGVDAVAFLSMSAALTLGATLAAIVVAVMYAGGNVLEDFAVARAERDLKSLVDRAPRIAHRSDGKTVEDIPVDAVRVGDTVLVHAGEIVPVDGVLFFGCRSRQICAYRRTDSSFACERRGLAKRIRKRGRSV